MWRYYTLLYSFDTPRLVQEVTLRFLGELVSYAAIP